MAEEENRGTLKERYKKTFRNDFIKKFKINHSESKGIIAIDSLGRSGSTLISLICTQLKREFSLGHGTACGDCRIFTIRNWNDVLVSYWKAGLSADNRYNEISSSKPTKSELDKIVLRLEGIQEKLSERYTPETLVLYYEKFYNNYDYIYDHLELFLDITIDNEKRDEITSNVSREAIKKIQNKLKNFSRWNGDIHGHHISDDDGLPGSWKKYLEFDLTTEDI